MSAPSVVCNNDDREGRCDADEGEPCAKCRAARRAEHDHFRARWDAATFDEKYGSEAYARQLREAGRKVKP